MNYRQIDTKSISGMQLSWTITQIFWAKPGSDRSRVIQRWKEGGADWREGGGDGGREGGRNGGADGREKRRGGREGGARVKPGNQLVL